MRICEVTGVNDDAKNIKTIEFNSVISIRPGQFVMAWLPGIDEIPLAITRTGDTSGITVDSVGPATEAFHSLRPGDKIGIRGPFGNGFDLSADDFLIIAGGTGMAALARAAQDIAAEGKGLRLAIGSKTAESLFFIDRMEKLGDVQIATDDGTAGHHGFVTEVAEKLIGEKRPEMILACGPEPMMAAALKVAGDIPIQCSLERYMKCGFGICGSCQCGKYTVCKDGPVFTGEQIAEIEDFGKFKRDASGRKVEF